MNEGSAIDIRPGVNIFAIDGAFLGILFGDWLIYLIPTLPPLFDLSVMQSN